MNFGPSEEQIMLAESVASFATRAFPLDRIRAFAESDERHASDLWQALAELGVAGMVIPESYGGVGLGVFDAALVAEALAYRVACVPFIGSAVLAPMALLWAGDEAQQKQWLPRLAAGEKVLGMALSEFAAGAREDAGLSVRDGRLYGKTLFVLEHAADAWIVAVGRDQLALVTVDVPGLICTHLPTVDRTRRVGELSFDGVAVQWLPHATGETLRRLMDLARVMLAADTLGAAQSMLDKAVAYAGERVQFGRPIGSFQAVKHMCAEMAAHLEPCRSMVWYAAHAQEHLPDEAFLLACHTKAHLAEVGNFVAKNAVEVHGGMGFTELSGLHYWFKRIGANRQLLGNPARCRAQAAEQELT
ncbi:MAG: alkylation response protein AidB-like acyl-CoA dehydrogenase [Bermanella sp.]|jgi:alkylation response protein AidB-like acyl-CoA dehydrogenase